MRVFFKFLGYSPWLFPLGLLALIAIEAVAIGSIPDLVHSESGSSVLRVIVTYIWIGSVYLSFIIPVLTLFLYTRQEFPFRYMNLYVYFSGTAVLWIIMLLNPFHAYSWFLG